MKMQTSWRRRSIASLLLVLTGVLPTALLMFLWSATNTSPVPCPRALKDIKLLSESSGAIATSEAAQQTEQENGVSTQTTQLSEFLDALTTSEAAKHPEQESSVYGRSNPPPESIDAITTSEAAQQTEQESGVSRQTTPPPGSNDTIARLRAAAQKATKGDFFRPPKRFKPRDGYQDLCCESFTDRGFDDEDLLKYMYGEQFNSNDTSGWGEIVVLGNQNSGIAALNAVKVAVGLGKRRIHRNQVLQAYSKGFLLGVCCSTGTSMTARLTALLGAYGGDRKNILITEKNALKFWEMMPLVYCHDCHILPFQRSTYSMVGEDFSFNKSQVSNKQLAAFQCFADRVMKELRRHPPSVMKDPRMPLAMGLWREHLPDLVCLIVYRDPGDNVRSLLSSVKGGRLETATPKQVMRWMNSWHTTLQFSLQNCIGRPTVVINMKNVTEHPQKATGNLYTLLTRAGVRGLHEPTDEEVDRKVTFSHYIRKGSDRGSPQSTMSVRLCRALLKPVHERPDVRRLLLGHEEDEEEPPTLQHNETVQAEMKLPAHVLGLKAALLDSIARQYSDDPLDPWDVAEVVLQMADGLENEILDMSPSLSALFHPENFGKLQKRPPKPKRKPAAPVTSAGTPDRSNAS